LKRSGEARAIQKGIVREGRSVPSEGKEKQELKNVPEKGGGKGDILPGLGRRKERCCLQVGFTATVTVKSHEGGGTGPKRLEGELRRQSKSRRNEERPKIVAGCAWKTGGRLDREDSPITIKWASRKRG